MPLAEASICLAHMASHDNDLFEAELRRINEYGVIDARGLSLTADLLDRILAAARNSRGHTVLRDARFDRATFDCVARFNELTFEGEANFGAAVFKYGVQFYGTNFKSIVRFQDATSILNPYSKRQSSIMLSSSMESSSKGPASGERH